MWYQKNISICIAAHAKFASYVFSMCSLKTAHHNVYSVKAPARFHFIPKLCATCSIITVSRRRKQTEVCSLMNGPTGVAGQVWVGVQHP